LAAHCCELINTCYSQTDCQQLDKCLGTCIETDGGGADGGIRGCGDACFAQHPQTANAFRAQLKCSIDSCPNDC
jgi:hypothetical protein